MNLEQTINVSKIIYEFISILNNLL